MLSNMYADIGYGMKSERNLLRVLQIVKSLFYFLELLL